MKRKIKNGAGTAKSPKAKKRRSVVLEVIHINPKYLEEKYEKEFKKGFESKISIVFHSSFYNFQNLLSLTGKFEISWRTVIMS